MDNPFETLHDKKDGLDFLLQIPKPFNIVPFALKFFPKYKITENALSNCLINESEIMELYSNGSFELSYNWYSPKKKEDLFWNCLYLLSSKSTFPRFLVRLLIRWEFTKKYTLIIVILVILNWYLKLLIIGIRRLARGQMNPINFIRVMKSKILKQTVDTEKRKFRYLDLNFSYIYFPI